MRRAFVRQAKLVCRRNLQHHAAHHPPIQVTTLPNKIRVATESTPGHFSSVGLYVDAGSRYETPSTSGTSHFLDRMAFKATSTRSTEEMSNDIDKLGGQIMCTSSRESIMYQSSQFHQSTPLALSLIADTVLQPAFLDSELEAQRDAARYEIRELSTKPELILPEVLHNVAYGNKTLGNSLLCPEDRIDSVNEIVMRTSMKEWYKPERMVIAGAGMHHEELVELADKYFSSLKGPTASTTSPRQATSSPQVPPHLLSPTPGSIYKSLTRSASSYLFPNSISPNPTIPGFFQPPLPSPPAHYTGGHRFIHDPGAEFNHLYIAFEGVGLSDEDIYALATMQVLLGGGGSFSAGGPGKGMYSRLYTNVLNHYTQIDHCASFHHIYTDSSLFGLFASFVPRPSGNSPAEVMPCLVHQLSLLLYSTIPKDELSRARNQLKSSLMMALESRAVEVEDLGRQLLVHNRKIPVAEMTARIDAVTASDIRRVASRVFGASSGAKATVVCMGTEDCDGYQGVFQNYGVGAM